MSNKNVYLYVCDTMSDWETGYLIAELNTGRYFKKEIAPFGVITVGIDENPVTTMGGVTILPRMSIDECRVGGGDVLILPGGNTWGNPIHDPLLQKATEAFGEGAIIAAICGATFGLAETGLLDNRRHTSNNLDYLKAVCPRYRGERFYENEPAVTDGNLVTASGIAPLEFAAHVLKALDVLSPEALQAWFRLNKTHESKRFFELMEAIQ